MTKAKMHLFQRIMERTKTQGDCLIWTGATAKAGYGNIKWEGDTYGVHRATWEAVKGPIPKDKWLRHRCGHLKCVKVDHMWLGPRGRLPGVKP